jgi:site-specific recombinase XerD
MAIHMQRLRVHGDGAKQRVVGFGHRSTDVVPENLSYVKLLEIKSSHCQPFI